MYTVVLMVAMTAGGSSPAWHRTGGHGVAWSGGCAGSCYGCYGYQGHVPYGGHGCIGTSGGYGISGPIAAYGCWGGWSNNYNTTVWSGPSSYGYGDRGMQGDGVQGYGIHFQGHGGYGGYGTFSGFGQSPVDPVMNIRDESNEPPMPKKVSEQTKARSTIIIDVPADAKLFVDGQLMKSTSTRRVIQTPVLNSDETYYYELRVELERDGKTVSESRRVLIQPGAEVVAAFRDPATARPDVATASSK